MLMGIGNLTRIVEKQGMLTSNSRDGEVAGLSVLQGVLGGDFVEDSSTVNLLQMDILVDGGDRLVNSLDVLEFGLSGLNGFNNGVVGRHCDLDVCSWKRGVVCCEVAVKFDSRNKEKIEKNEKE
jgi:hypothetical protein